MSSKSLWNLLHMLGLPSIAMAISINSSVLFAAQYDSGASDTEIKIGNIAPITGPLSAIATYAKAAGAYFNKINKEEGGVNNRKLVFISKDDAYDPIQTTEVTRKLVEDERVLLIFLPHGTGTSLAVKDYLSRRHVPQLFIIGGADEFYDPDKSPWSIAIYPKYGFEAKILADYLLTKKPEAKVAILHLKTTSSIGFLNGFYDTLGKKSADMVIKSMPINPTDSSAKSQLDFLTKTGANTFLLFLVGKLAIPVMQQAYDNGWKPQLLILSQLARMDVLKSVGLERMKGTIAAHIYKDPADPRWENDEAVNEYRAFMKKYYEDGNANDQYNLMGYFAGQLLVDILKKAGDTLTRENIMNIARNMDYTSKDFPVLLPGIEIHTTPTDHNMFSTMILMEFDGHSWVPVKM
jgi:branched-chain amino acid transport system substrate-binding protein